MQTTAFLNGDLIAPDGIVRDGLVVARGERIEYTGPRRDELIPPEAARVDAGGLYISPGFIDIHVHGGAGSDFMDATAEDVLAVMRYHSAHGTTSLTPTTCAAPLEDILAAIDAVEKYDGRFGRSLGMHLEGPYFAPAKKGCHLPQWVRDPDEREWREMLERGCIARMTLAPERPGMRPLVEELRRRSAVASAGHSEAVYPEMMEAADWGVTHVTHLYSVMTDALNNRWRGTANPRHGGILEAVYLDGRLTTEVIADGVHLTPELLQLPFRVKGPEGVAIVTDAMRGAGMPDGDYTFGPRDGMMATKRGGEARVKDGVGLASSVCPLNEMVRIQREATGCPLWKAVRMATLTPAEILGREADVGSLAPGRFADVVIIDKNVSVKAVYVGTRALPQPD